MSDTIAMLSGTASGNILPRSFVKGDGSNAYQYLQCGLGDRPIGISDPGTNTYPNPANGTLYCAAANDPVGVYTPGMRCYLTLGAGGATAFQRLKPDANGNGIVAYPGDLAGAIALDSGASGEAIEVLVIQASYANDTLLVTSAVAVALSASQAGADVYSTGVDQVVTLPPITGTAGMKFRLTAAAATASIAGGSTGTILAINAADAAAVKMIGNGFTAANGKGAKLTPGTGRQGDNILVESDGSNWWIKSVLGTWVVQP